MSKARTIYEIFNGWTIAQINAVIEKLPKQDKDLLNLKYGNNLEYPVFNNNMTEIEKKQFYYVVRKIGYSLKNSVEFRRKYCKYVESVYDYFKDYSKEQVDNALSRLKETERQHLNRIITLDRENFNATEQVKSSKDQLFYRILSKIKDLLENPNKIYHPNSGKPLKSIYEYFENYSKERVDIVLENLNFQEKELIRRRYGEDLSNPVSNPNWTKKDHNDFYKRLFPKLKSVLKNYSKIDSQGTRGPISIYKRFFDYSKVQIDSVLDMLTKEEQRLIALKYGENLECPKTSSKMTSQEDNRLKYILETRIPLLLQNSISENDLFVILKSGVFTYFSQYSEESLKKSITSLSLEEINLLRELINNDYSENCLSLEDKSNACKIFTKLNLILNNKYNDNMIMGRKVKSIYEYFSEYSKQQIDTMLTQLNNYEKRLVSLKYGNNLSLPFTDPSMTKSEKSQFVYLLTVKMRKKLEQPVEEKSPIVINEDNNSLTKENLIKIRKALHSNIYFSFLRDYSAKEAIVLIMRLGYIDCINFSIESIAEFVGIDIVEVIMIIEKYNNSTAVNSAKKNLKQKISDRL